MAITLVDLAKRAPTPFEAGTIKTFLKVFPVAEELPLVTKGALKAFWREEGSLPTVENRYLNQEFSDYSTGHDIERSIQLPIYGGLLRIDHQILSEPGGDEEWASQQRKKLRAMAYRLASDFIVGDPATSPKAMAGLKVWSTKLASRYTIDLSSLDLSTDAQREANARTIVRRMQEMMITMEDGSGEPPNLILMNVTTFLYLADAMRVSGFLKTTMDATERTMDSFMGARIMRVGYGAPTGIGPSTQTELLANNHDGSTGITSIYFLRTGEDYCHLLQKHDMRAVDLGGSAKAGTPDTGGTFIKRLIEWPVVFRAKHPASLGRLKGLKVA